MMSMRATAIYERGVLRLLTPVSLPEHTRVQILILDDKEPENDLRSAEAALIAAGLLKPTEPPPEVRTLTKDRRAELADLYASGGPLSEDIIAGRDARPNHPIQHPQPTALSPETKSALS
jgi:predicted DNA-binding antitoxin AbrB/MazE fold protein